MHGRHMHGRLLDGACIVCTRMHVRAGRLACWYAGGAGASSACPCTCECAHVFVSMYGLQKCPTQVKPPTPEPTQIGRLMTEYGLFLG